MAADRPNDKRHLLVAFVRPTPICMAACRAIGGPLPTAIAVFLDRETSQVSLVDVTA